MSLQEKAEALSHFLRNRDLQKTAEEDLTDLIITTLSGDPISTGVAGKKVIDDIRNLPGYILWDKINRYLRGSFRSFEDQIKLASRFDKDSKDYARFVKKMILLIDQVEDDEKIDFYANLTRAFFMGLVDSDVFFKLTKFLLLLTFDELIFIRDCPEDFRSTLTVMISSLYQFGLFDQIQVDGNETRYVLSSFALSLKRNCLNIEEGVNGKERLGNYSELQPLKINEAATDADFDRMFSESFHFDEGKLTLGRQQKKADDTALL